jgi:hypothetical protein
MNLPQLYSAIRWFLSVVGAILAAKGLIDKTAFAAVIDKIMEAAPVVTNAVGVVMALAPLVWGLFKHTNTNTVKAAAEVPGVSQIIAAPVIANAIPGDKVVTRAQANK